jgi:amino acid adenylation domain-containing protein
MSASRSPKPSQLLREMQMLHEYVLVQAERRSDALAVVMGAERWRYEQLEAASNQLARMLVDAGCRPGDRVCIFAAKSPRAIIGMLATLKAGCAYVPIDVECPAARTAHIVRAAEPTTILAEHASAELIEQLRQTGALTPHARVGALDPAPAAGSALQPAFDPEATAGCSTEPLASVGGPESIAHILFTSGSTGVPKGVMITHANVTAFLDWAVPYFGTKPGERISGHPPLHFDLSTFDIYGTFRAGAELHLVPPGTLLPRALTEFIQRGELTQWFSVPSTFTYMANFNAIPPEGFPSLERVLWCGEVLPTPVLMHWMQRVPRARFTNLYGPTEATIASSYYTVPSVPENEAESIPIGAACAGEQLFVLDDELHSVPEGEVGNLYIGGAGLSPGYWRDAEKTAVAFVPYSRSDDGARRIYRTGDLACAGADGLMRFLGRADSQIKSRGYRIELGEIEVALHAVPGVGECVVVGVAADGFEGTTICCAFAPVEGTDLPAPQLRAALSVSLPHYMIPSRWLAMERLPKNVNGKVDRRLLREQFENTLTARSAPGAHDRG